MSTLIIENKALTAVFRLAALILKERLDNAERFITAIFNDKPFSYFDLQAATHEDYFQGARDAGIRIVLREAGNLTAAFKLFSPAVPLCTDPQCLLPAIYIDPRGGTWTTSLPEKPCPHCGEILRPSALKTHATLWWNGSVEEVGVPQYEGAEILPDTDQKIRDYLARHRLALHPFIELALKHELGGVEEPLCRFLNALAACPDLRVFKNGRNRLGLIAALADAAFIAQMGEGNIKLAGIKACERWWIDPENCKPVTRVTPPSCASSIPRTSVNPPTGKTTRELPSSSHIRTAPASRVYPTTPVVLLYPSLSSSSRASDMNQRLILELRMHLAPLFATHGVVLWDRDQSDFPEEEIRDKIRASALIICLTSPYFFDEEIKDGSVIARAVRVMSSAQCADKTVVIRLQQHADISEGFFYNLPSVTQRSLSAITDGRDEAWFAIVEHIRRKMGLARESVQLDAAMVPEKLRMAAYATLLNLSEFQFRNVVEHLEMSWRDFIPKTAGSREHALIDRCLRHGRFITMRQAIEQVTRL